MSKVNTVLGPVDSSALGYTRLHEHLLWMWPGIESDPLVDFDEESTAKAVTEILLAMKNRGVSTVVDATPINLSRRADFLVRMAESSGMNIIASTGFSDIPFLPFYYAQMDVDHLAAIMDYEVTKGIRGTNAKAGIIKVGTARGTVAESEEKILRAAARVSRSANVPIITHTVDGTLGIDQIDILESEGADLSRVVIGHTCGSSDIAYYLGIIERGANAGFDRIGWTEFQSDEVRLVAIAGLIGAGYADRIVLSQDILAFLAVVPGLPTPKEECSPTYLEDEFIPRLQQGSISPKSIEQIMIYNPLRIFSESD
jgi:phosphotriesterase-related protein